MAEKITVTFELDADLKEAAEKLFKGVGMTLAEAFKLFAKTSVETGKIQLVKRKTAAGMLSEYANPAMIPFEKDAWPEAAVERYARSFG